MTDEAWIDTVRLARDFGTVDLLFPDGIADLRDLPHTLFDLIRRAMQFLSFDELPNDEKPPKRIWLNADALREWFDDVKAKRNRDLGSDPAADIENPVENEAAKGLIVG